jgi:hypothetical protein
VDVGLMIKKIMFTETSLDWPKMQSKRVH